MHDAPLIVAEGLGKTYRDYPSPWSRLWETLSRRRQHRPIHALQGVSFRLDPGESLAVVGENGAGKSTLLKILSGVTVPTVGSMEVRGRVASLLELGMGFHPELTGRQNIRLNAAMMGLDDEAIAQRTPEILDFSELGDFIDRPVKTYSTGMAMRLGFAIAAQLEPDVLIVDEALSVGDGYFQKKCMDRIRQLLDGGTTLLFCSHALYYVTTFCRRALWLKDGRPVALGSAEEVVREYENFLLDKETLGREAAEPVPERTVAQITDVTVRRGAPARSAGSDAAAAERRVTVRCRQPLEIEISWRSREETSLFHVGVGIDRIDGVEVLSLATHFSDLPPRVGSGRVRLRLDEVPMVKGEYDLNVYLLDDHGTHVYDRKQLGRAFVVEPEDPPYGLVRCPHRWTEVAEPEQDADAPALVAGSVR